jgi:hypothetical protein
MTNPPHGGQPPGEPGPPQQWPEQPWPRPGPQQSGPWGPPVPGPYGGQPAYGQGPYGPPSPQHGQPWGGQPPYGPPAAPRRSRKGLVAGVVVPAVLLVLAVVLARLLGDTVLDTGRVEDDVAAQFAERYGVAVDLTCDHEMQVEQGADYECTGTTADGEEVTLRIVITDEQTAAYTWDEV